MQISIWRYRTIRVIGQFPHTVSDTTGRSRYLAYAWLQEKKYACHNRGMINLLKSNELKYEN